jgi:hypothetical protein
LTAIRERTRSLGIIELLLIPSGGISRVNPLDFVHKNRSKLASWGRQPPDFSSGKKSIISSADFHYPRARISPSCPTATGSPAHKSSFFFEQVICHPKFFVE